MTVLSNLCQHTDSRAAVVQQGGIAAALSAIDSCLAGASGPAAVSAVISATGVLQAATRLIGFAALQAEDKAMLVRRTCSESPTNANGTSGTSPRTACLQTPHPKQRLLLWCSCADICGLHGPLRCRGAAVLRCGSHAGSCGPGAEERRWQWVRQCRRASLRTHRCGCTSTEGLGNAGPASRRYGTVCL